MKPAGGVGNLNQAQLQGQIAATMPAPAGGVANSPNVGAALTPVAQEFRKALGNAAVGPKSVVSANAEVAQTNVSQLKFSNHAIERMHSRGISFSPEQVQKLEGAVDRAAQKGSKDTLVLSGDNAFIVSVKNKTVVTVMDKNAMKDNVFTNIDSTVMI